MDFYKTGKKESVFKIEEKMKRDMLVRVGSLAIDETNDSGTESMASETENTAQ